MQLFGSQNKRTRDYELNEGCSEMSKSGLNQDSGTVRLQVFSVFLRRLKNSSRFLHKFSTEAGFIRFGFALTLISTSLLAGCSKSSGWVRRGLGDDSGADDRSVARLEEVAAPESASDADRSRERKFQLTGMTKPVGEPSLITLGPGDSFESHIQNAQGVVLVDFFAEWCGPCKKQSVILHDLEPEAAEYGAKIIKIDVDEHKDIAKKFGVSSMPTLIVFKNGEIVDRQTGLTDRRSVKRLLKM